MVERDTFDADKQPTAKPPANPPVPLLMTRSWPRAILHVDADAFFASCEQAVHPEYRGQPVITGLERGIVAAASYEAKARGVKRGTPLSEVKKLIPEAIIVPSDYETYSLFSKRMFEIMRRYSPVVEEYSIDEGFMELTGLRRKYHCSYFKIAQQLKDALERELGLSMAIGLSLSKTLAKLGSKYDKPGGLTVIPGRLVYRFLDETALEKIWGVGPATAAYGRILGLNTALDFARRPESFIKNNFTKPHHELWHELNGRAVWPINTETKEQYISISKTKTFTPPARHAHLVFAQLLKNLENACIKARRHRLVARGLIIYLRTKDFSGDGLKARLSRSSAYPGDITPLARQLFKKIYKPQEWYRATGVVLLDLISAQNIQQSLFEPPLRLEKLQKVWLAVDQLAKKMGKHTVHLAASKAAQSRNGTSAGTTVSAQTPNPITANAPSTHSPRVSVTQRQLNRLPGESARKHLAIPLLMSPKKLPK